MADQTRYRISLISGILALVLLSALTFIAPPDSVDVVAALLFCALIGFSMTLGVPLGGGTVSLMPMTAAAAYLVMGLVPAGWVTFVGAIIHGSLRYTGIGQSVEHKAPSSKALAARTATNAAMHSGSILAGGAVFQALGGTTPLEAVDGSTLLRLALLGLTQLSVNYLIAGSYIAMRGQAQLRSYLRSLPTMVLFEGGPLVFSVLTALTYTRLGMGYFVLLGLNLVVGSLISHNLDRVNRRLGQRVKELDSLQAVGQALSTSLDIETVVSTIHTQVAKLMPTQEFFIALHEPQTNQVSFPLAIQDGVRVQWAPRRAGNGLTEYVIKTQAPLLIQGNVRRKVTALGLDYNEQEAQCWLGVPILVGTESLGVIVVKSATDPETYTASHQRVLLTIAAQASTAIQNARRYVRTHRALTRRLQELDSILRTARDGFLLLDLDWRVLTVNRTLVDWVDIAQPNVTGQFLDAALPTGESLIRLIGYTPKMLKADCDTLVQGTSTEKRAIVLLGSSMRHVERTLFPVRDQQGVITGWLMAFRDMAEEMEFERLKDDMTEMLVHDLRSPLTAVIGGLALIKTAFGKRDAEGFERLRTMAAQSADRILGIVNQLLDISRLESGQLPLEYEPLDVESLLQDVVSRFEHLADDGQIGLTVEVATGLPTLCADASLISRVLDNLVDNAIKFTPDGEHVRLWARCQTEPGFDAILVGVTDTGPGIPQEAQSRIFEKFQQLGSIEGRRGGTGLGLTFCRLAIEAHGGRIWVESEVGKGSTFAFLLPVEGKPNQYERKNR